MNVRKFRFLITYFKDTGKYYTTALVTWHCKRLEPKDEPDVGAYAPTETNEENGTPYIHDAVAKLRGLRDTGGPGALPGLCGDGWDGPILIQIATLVNPGQHSKSPDDYYGCGLPHLLMPRG
jgi:hypothetical protein